MSDYRCAGCGLAAFHFDGLGLCRECSKKVREERGGER